MSAGQIDDVDVVADARAVGRGIVVAEDHDLLALTERDLQHDRNQMRFGVVVFAQVSFRRSPSGIEIS